MIEDCRTVVARLHQARNRHDVGALVACFAPYYQGAQSSIPPDRTLQGRDRVRMSWSIIFRDVPDFQAAMLRVYSIGDTVWAEWRWHDTPVSDERFNWHGVTLFGIKNDQITWGHFYAVVMHRITVSTTEQSMTSMAGRRSYAAAPSSGASRSRGR